LFFRNVVVQSYKSYTILSAIKSTSFVFCNSYRILPAVKTTHWFILQLCKKTDF